MDRMEVPARRSRFSFVARSAAVSLAFDAAVGPGRVLPSAPGTIATVGSVNSINHCVASRMYRELSVAATRPGHSVAPLSSDSRTVHLLEGHNHKEAAEFHPRHCTWRALGKRRRVALTYSSPPCSKTVLRSSRIYFNSRAKLRVFRGVGAKVWEPATSDQEPHGYYSQFIARAANMLCLVDGGQRHRLLRLQLTQCFWRRACGCWGVLMAWRE